METFSAYLAFCVENPLGHYTWSSISSTFHKGPVMRSFNVFFCVSLNEPLNEQSSCRWFDTPWRSCVVIIMLRIWSSAHWNRKNNSRIYTKMDWIIITYIHQHYSIAATQLASRSDVQPFRVLRMEIKSFAGLAKQWTAEQSNVFQSFLSHLY